LARKKRVSVVTRLERAVSDVANAASVAATGSEIGVLELAVEDEINPRPTRRRNAKAAARKRSPGKKIKRKPAVKKSRKPLETKRTARRPPR
jgi:hypothetical protein